MKLKGKGSRAKKFKKISNSARNELTTANTKSIIWKKTPNILFPTTKTEGIYGVDKQ